MTFPAYLSAKHLAERLDVSEQWLFQKAAAGEIPSHKFHGLRRFREDEVLAWLEQQAEGKLAEVVELRGVS